MLSNSQTERALKQEHEEIFRNHVPYFLLISVGATDSTPLVQRTRAIFNHMCAVSSPPSWQRDRRRRRRRRRLSQDEGRKHLRLRLRARLQHAMQAASQPASSASGCAPLTFSIARSLANSPRARQAEIWRGAAGRVGRHHSEKLSQDSCTEIG